MFKSHLAGLPLGDDPVACKEGVCQCRFACADSPDTMCKGVGARSGYYRG